MSKTVSIILEIPQEINEILVEYQGLLRDSVYLSAGIEPTPQNRQKVAAPKKIAKALILQMLLEKVKRDMRIEVENLRRENEKLLKLIHNKNSKND